MTKPQRGFTLIELIIFIVVVSVGLAGILSVMNTVVKSSADPMVRKQAVAIAESLLEEILLKQYSNPTGGYSGTDRSKFDDVSDYAGYSTTAGIVDLVGTAIPGLTSYNISPPVTVIVSGDLTGVTSKKITVSVTGPGVSVSLSGYRANY
ncbi:prepilin-type N-terminal cleavage/methylation domain-containing protein [Rhodoferax sp.]|uniref:type IV pilus modification PilV family protein n=1 Tax=Rhodoferax sp. TaxID=50421 RepID=UPI002846F706|nr:prepilin-type N-terminal cleavage/methylation domain-containing protein [Rhodoferax sp.]MDR3370371.1 prepilin-type N-terminal cleavage/methylation domain-containing protein [Rhodoferax sp.]